VTITAEQIKTTQNRIVKIEADRASNRERISGHERKASEYADEAAKFATDAANGNDKALDKHLKAKGTETLHREQARILQATDGELQNQLAEAHATRDWLLIRIELEKLVGDASDLRAIAREFREALAVPVEKSGALKTRLKVIFTKALPRLGPRKNLAALEKSITQSVDHAVRSQLQKSFGAVGINVADSRYENADFEVVLEKPIGDLMAAIESAMHTASPERVAGRMMFRARTQINGLHGMHLKAGDTVSLEVNHPDVRRMIDAGALEEIGETKGATA
jgi:hypothetical protein